MQPIDKRCIMRLTQPLIFLRKETRLFIGIKPTVIQTLSIGWTGPFLVTEKVSVVDYRVQLKLTGLSKVVQVDQLILDPCHQDRANWVRDELAHQIKEKVINVGTDPIVSQQTTAGVSIACQTFDTDPIIISKDKSALMIMVRRSSRRRRKPSHLIYYLHI